MKKYYIHYYRDFGNTYNLYWTDSEEMECKLPQGAERITRKEAEQFARSERERRQFDQSFSGYAASAIYPSDYDGKCGDIRDSRDHELVGYIWEKIRR